MIIKSFYIKEKFVENIDTFSEKRNLIYSKSNSKGKSTYLRLLFYALGYSIPQMKDIKYSDIVTELYFEEKGVEFCATREENLFWVENFTNQEVIYYSLPSEQEAFLAYIFNYDNIKVLKNLLGIIYVDQDKGWSLLNRGKVIGRIGFSIEELLAGLNNVDCDELLAEKSRLQSEKKKYTALLNIQELSDEVYEKNGEIFISDIEKELQNKISLCNLKIAHMKTSLLEIEEVLKEDRAFYSYIDTMKLEVQQDEVIIPVNRNTIRNAKSNLEFLKARRAILLTGIEKLNREKSSLQDKLQDYLEKNTPITSLMGSSADIIINKQLATVSVDQTVVEGLLEEVTNRLKEVNKLLKFKIKNNNPYIDDIYNYVLKYAKILKIDDKMTNKADYIFTDDLKSMSGAILQKMVFAFKIAFLKVIEKEMNTKLFMVLDSPKGKELDDNNSKLIDKIISDELGENQVLIASIYEFTSEKKITLENRAIEGRKG